MQYRHAAVWVALALVATGCRSADPAGGESEDLELRAQSFSVVSKNVLGVVDAYFLDRVLARKPVTLRRVVLNASPEAGISVLTARVKFSRGHGGRKNNMTLGLGCTDVWPPLGFGPTSPLEGLRIGAGEIFAINVFVGVNRPGDWTIAGAHLDYEIEGRAGRATSTALNVEVIRRRSRDELPDGKASCAPMRDSNWFKPDTGIGS